MRYSRAGAGSEVDVAGGDDCTESVSIVTEPVSRKIPESVADGFEVIDQERAVDEK